MAGKYSARDITQGFLVYVVTGMLYIKDAIQAGERCSRGHVFIEEQLVFVDTCSSLVTDVLSAYPIVHGFFDFS